MNKTLSLVSAAALAAFAAFPAEGGIVYDNTNGFANDYSLSAWVISETTGDAIADQFVPGASDTIQSVNLWLWECTGLPTCGTTEDLTSLDWSIVANNGGADYPFAGSVVASGTDTTPGVFVQRNSLGAAIFEESFNISGVAVTGGATYWLVIDNAVTVSGNQIAWDQSDGPTTAYQFYAGSSTNLTAGCGTADNPGTTCTESFQLLDTSASVPEPGTVLLFAAGLIGFDLVPPRTSRI